MTQPQNHPPLPTGPYLIKNVASCNTTTRSRALKLLTTTWLPSQPKISDTDMNKLWKGLFYCLWHADKAQAQSDLIDRLTSLLLGLDLPLALHYFSAFFFTMRREWPGIDHLRLDKFYLLVRRFMRVVFLMLKKNAWDSQLLRAVNGVLVDEGFLRDVNTMGNGVNYHLVSVYLDELKPFLPAKLEVVWFLLEPFFAVMGKSQHKVLVDKVKSNMFDVLLNMGRSLLGKKKLGVDGDAEMGHEIVVFGTIAMKTGLSGKFYELGTSPDCLQWNRKVVFGLHEEFLRLEKDLESSGIEILVPEVTFDDEDEVPKLIPIAGGETEGEGASGVIVEGAEVDLDGANASARNNLKKTKKKRNKGLNGSNKQAKKKKKKKDGLSQNCFTVERSEGMITVNGDSSSNGLDSNENLITLNESVISNLQMQFEKVAAGVGMDMDDTSSFHSPKITMKRSPSKKRKRVKIVDGQDPDLTSQGDAAGKSAENTAKKVRFAMKNNLVWKPHSPLPPQSLRLPPSVTPRGSALKKGIRPGPIREMPPAMKKVKQIRKLRKLIKTVSPAIKRLRKLDALSV